MTTWFTLLTVATITSTIVLSDLILLLLQLFLVVGRLTTLDSDHSTSAPIWISVLWFVSWSFGAWWHPNLIYRPTRQFDRRP